MSVKDLNIHWYPGHMARAAKEISAFVRIADLIVYVLDARVPGSCINKDMEGIIGQKPVLFVLSKADLSDPASNSRWLAELRRYGMASSINATMSNAGRSILGKIRELAESKRGRYANRGVNYTPRAVVIGVPNTGKSTLINCLCGSRKAVTGDKPGVTRGRQWVRLESVDLLDTPGTLPHKFDDKIAARNLAFVGSIRDETLDIPALAEELIALLNGMDKRLLPTRYGAEISSCADIAVRRGFLLAGGVADTDRAAYALINEFRAGKLGRLTLEQPEEASDDKDS